MLAALIEMCKLRIVALLLVTAAVGAMVALPPLQTVPLVFWTLLGIGFCCASAAVMNNLLDAKIDRQMQRTASRALALKRVAEPTAWIWCLALAVAGLLILYLKANPLAAVVTLLAILGYGFIYTRFLKPLTPQNIVIGGLSGASPPLLGWLGVTGSIHPEALLQVLVIFFVDTRPFLGFGSRSQGRVCSVRHSHVAGGLRR